MRRVDLNVDIGEGYPFDDALLEFASSANVCCGQHAGSWDLTLETAEKCRSRGVRVGAHPGFPDRENMGRRTPTPNERPAWEESIRDQIDRFRREIGGAYVKPHGALYNALVALETDEVEEALSRYGLNEGFVMVLAGSPVARTVGGRALAEGFADRRQLPSGALAPRSEPGAVLTDPAEVACRAVSLAPLVDSLCLHGDTAGCVDMARAVVCALHDAGWEVGT